VKDLAQNSARAIANTAALAVTPFVTDDIAPQLPSYIHTRHEHYSSDMTFTFSEIMSAQFFALPELVLQSTATRASVSFQCLGGSSAVNNSSILAATLSAATANSVRAEVGLANTAGSTCVSMIQHIVISGGTPSVVADAIRDMTGNRVTGNRVALVPSLQALAVSSYVADTTPAQLSAFGIDSSNGSIVLSFDSPVLANTLTLTLNSHCWPVATAGDVSFTLTSGAATSPISLTTTVTYANCS
jgi:hypothetical protein